MRVVLAVSLTIRPLNRWDRLKEKTPSSPAKQRGCGDFGVRSILTLHGRHRTPGYDDQGKDSNSANVKHGFTVSLLSSPLLIHLIVRTLRP